MPFILLIVLLPLVLVALTPVLLIQRYRVASSRQPARRWLIILAIVSTGISLVFLLVSSALTNIWIADAFGDTSLGIVAGCVLGIGGLMLTQWEATHRSLHYTPNRWMALAIVLLIAGRVAFGLYRIGTADTFGIAESLGVAGLLLGYHLTYNVGIILRLRRWDRRALRVMN